MGVKTHATGQGGKYDRSAKDRRTKKKEEQRGGWGGGGGLLK